MQPALPHSARPRRRLAPSVLLAAACGGLLLPLPPALGAPLASAELRFDWTSLQLTPLAVAGGPVPSLSWQQRSSVAEAYGNAPLTAPDWTTPLSRPTAVAPGTGSLSALDAEGLLARSEDADEDSLNTGTWTLRDGQFSVQGSGALQVSVNLTWQVALLPPGAGADPYGQFANAFGSVVAETRYDPRGIPNRHGEASFSAQKSGVFPGDTGALQGEYLLTFTVDVQDGDWFYFTAYAGSTASIITPVPEPAGAGLLALGLAGVLGTAQRLRRHGGGTAVPGR